jgi:hypothetical protein
MYTDFHKGWLLGALGACSGVWVSLLYIIGFRVICIARHDRFISLPWFLAIMFFPFHHCLCIHRLRSSE